MTSTQRRLVPMSRVFYKEAVGCFIVFDVANGSTFEGVTKWKTELDDKVCLNNGRPVPCVLLANKVNIHSFVRIKENVLRSISSVI